MITWLKEKHRKRKPTQMGYRRPPDNGDSAVRRKRKRATEAEKLRMLATQPDVVVVMDAVTGHTTRKRTKKGIRTA